MQLFVLSRLKARKHTKNFTRFFQMLAQHLEEDVYCGFFEERMQPQ